jgi:hypothetical protein
MDWQRKAAALNALAEIKISIRTPGDWYVLQSVNIREKNVMVGVCGNGKTPEEAIEDHWRQAVDDIIEDHWRQAVDDIGDHYLVAREGGHPRRAVRWNGFMWEDVPEPTKSAA